MSGLLVWARLVCALAQVDLHVLFAPVLSRLRLPRALYSGWAFKQALVGIKITFVPKLVFGAVASMVFGTAACATWFILEIAKHVSCNFGAQFEFARRALETGG